jgi:hypothetical protein
MVMISKISTVFSATAFLIVAIMAMLAYSIVKPAKRLWPPSGPEILAILPGNNK